MLAFIIFVMVALIFVAIGISAFFAKKPMGFFANAEMFEVTDVKAYNRAVGIMWCIYGIVMIIFGIPLLAGQNSPYALISMAGVVVETIALVVVYVLVIEKKYRKR
ncbi:MAG: hypothetical protein J6L69_09230 [Lachnospiraceae bacterium]|nr:hypothetical protein [Lachnospiraceae bacterium]